MNEDTNRIDPCLFHLWFAWHPLIFRDQFDRLVFVWFEQVWRRWCPGSGWEYEIVL